MQNLPTQIASDTNPLVSIDVVGDRRILEPDGSTAFKTTFRVTANPAPASGSPITVGIDVSQEGTYISEDLTNDILAKTVTLTNAESFADFDVALIGNEANDIAGKIIAVVQESTDAPATYQRGLYSRTASVKIVDDESLPVLTINNPDIVSESAGSVTFKITANSQPAGDSLRVHYGTREPTGDFLVHNAIVYADSQLIDFTAVGGSTTDYEGDLVIELDNDEVAEHDGSVSVTLVSDANFTYRVVAGSNDVGVVQVTDDEVLPILTIANAAPIAESAGSASFTVTSDTQVTDLEVHYELREPTGDFLATSDSVIEDSANLTFDTQPNAEGNYDATLVIQIEDDLRDESDGSVSVTLLTDPGLTYRVTPGSSDVGTVQVTDDDAFTTSVSLATEYLPTGATTATYYILANPAPASALDVKYEYNYRNASDRLVGPWTKQV